MRGKGHEGYPRTCPSGHAIASPRDEYSNGRTGRRKCAACVLGRSRDPKNARARADAKAKYEASTKGIVGRVRRDLRYARQTLETT